jgi:hypothetical protein
MLCSYMGKGKEKDDGSPLVTKAALQNRAPVSCSATHPCRINTSHSDPHNSVEDSLGFAEAGHAVDTEGNRDTQDVLSEEMPEKTDTTMAGGGDTVIMLTTVDETGAVVHVVHVVSHPQPLYAEVQAKISRIVSLEETQPTAMKGKT